MVLRFDVASLLALHELLRKLGAVVASLGGEALGVTVGDEGF